MLFKLLKFPSKIALLFFCRHIIIQNKKALNHSGPLLIACNHPNSFLDAIILAALFKKPIYSLARGDVFKNKRIAKILIALNILPVFRITEGAENLNTNYDTFAKCREIFKKNGIVLIFSEGLCVNEWKLRALKKGTARLAFSAWNDGINLTVIPAGINYQSFRSFGKNVQLNFGTPILKAHFNASETEGVNIKAFNEQLKSELKSLVVEIESHQKETIKTIFQIKQHPIKKSMLIVPAFIGKIVHAPLFIPVHKISWEHFEKLDHYDSVVVGLLFLLYPLYLLIISSILFALLGGWYWLLVFIILPFLAWSFIQLKKQF
ncbi:MAG: 1-acyl-sn-glycerol-3-phosphate acyltransferase [Sphingobacteriales bacterium]|nr:1-acyl-sn-glycerol-3-phosphate acyltransferase [Sphingobacteriales bacterium]